MLPFFAYMASLALPAIHAHGVQGYVRIDGISVLIFGWLGPIINLQFAWYANPPFIIAWIVGAFGRFRIALFTAAIAGVRSLNTFTLYVRGELGVEESVTFISLGWGAYLWLSAIWGLVLWSFWASSQFSPDRAVW
jgi:hypothetical protein